MNRRLRYVIGVDEAGRGPLAGPVTVAAVLMRPPFRRQLGQIKDSKRLSPPAREVWWRTIRDWRRRGKIAFAVASSGHQIIDRQGIVRAIRQAINRALRRLAIDPAVCLVLLDGSLQAPAIFTRQRTIIRGDETESIIALASIIAKVRRDRRMERLAKRHPGYGFEIHKGYGTRRHYRALRQSGFSAIHRRSFLQSL